MNQISKQVFAAGSALDLRSGNIPSAAPSEAARTDLCISAIDEAVENLRRLTGAAASSPSPDCNKATADFAASDAADMARAAAVQVPLPQKTVMPEVLPKAWNAEPAPPAAVMQGPTPTKPVEAKPVEAPAQSQIEARAVPELPKEKIELKSSPTMPFAKTIEGESGPISEVDRRLRTGGGGNGKNSDPGGGRGGVGEAAAVFTSAASL
ncbi:type I secretion system ATPase [Rhizobium sp. CCGE 510]|nr:type I secretion system ATPase [Rhizobium sp. CCGE 510]